MGGRTKNFVEYEIVDHIKIYNFCYSNFFLRWVLKDLQPENFFVKIVFENNSEMGGRTKNFVEYKIVDHIKIYNFCYLKFFLRLLLKDLYPENFCAKIVFGNNSKIRSHTKNFLDTKL